MTTRPARGRRAGPGQLRLPSVREKGDQDDDRKRNAEEEKKDGSHAGSQ
jgi:hypothetical protein